MNNIVVRIVAFSLVALLAACASTPDPQGIRGTEVTRFHLGAPIAGQQISIEPANPGYGGSLEYQTYARIVAAELGRVGFSPTELEASEMVAVIGVDRGTREAVARRSPVSIGIGGGSFGGGLGLGAGASFGVGGSRGGEVTVTQLDVKLKRRSEGTVVWEGRAIRADETGELDPAVTIQRLAAALFRGFPGESGATITVE